VARKQSDEDILATARERFRLAEEAESLIRKDALDDLRFCAGEQWSQADKNSRGDGQPGGRPCLTFNKLIGPLNQTSNEARVNQAGVRVRPVDSATDPDTAKVIEGMIRHIENVCKADEVYETALEQSTAGSFGYFRVTTRYCGPKSFEQELRIERIIDPFSVFLDPYAREADKSDMRYAFEIETWSKDDYKQEYGDTELASLNFFEGMTNPVPGWVDKSGIRIARYWTVETVPRTLSQIEWRDGTRTSQYKDTLPDEMPAGTKVVLDAKDKPVERDTEERQVKCYKINGVEILDEIDWPGQWIPILPVLGKEMYIEGKRRIFSLVRFAKDPQRFYNFCRSSEAETIMLGAKAPWIGVKGQFKDDRWAKANTVPYAYLEYEPLDIAGNPAPPPQRNVFEPPIQAVSLAAAQASDDIKATTGIFDASLGAQGNETSGIAIRQRQSQTGLSNAHFIDNLNRAIRQCGVILCDLIPKIYDTPRQVRILGEDRAQQIIMVNQPFRDWPAPLKAQSTTLADDKCYDLSSGQYDVVTSAGPTTPTQRQETWETLTQLAQSYPQLIQIAGDILFENADFPGADKLAERLRKTLPPGLADPPGNQQQQLQMLAAQYQQSQQAIAQLTEALQNAQEELRTKSVERQSHERIEYAKIESNDRQAALKAQVDLITTEAKVKSTEDITLLKTQVAALEAQISRMWSGAAAEQEEQEIPATSASTGMAAAAQPPAPPQMTG